MSLLRFPFSILIALVVLLVAQFAYYYPQLPETVASHFDINGVPNGWMSKTTFGVVMAFVTILTIGSTAGIALLLPHMQDAINIPNKDYWLAPERREETMAFIGSSLLWIACAVVLLLLVINFYVFRMNMEKTPALALPMIPTLLTFLGVIGIIIARAILRFRKTETTTT